MDDGRAHREGRVAARPNTRNGRAARVGGSDYHEVGAGVQKENESLPAGGPSLLEWSGSESNRRPPARKASPMVIRHLDPRAHFAVSRHFDSQWLVAFCTLQHSLTGPIRDGSGASAQDPEGSQSSTSPSGLRRGVVMVSQWEQ